MIERWSRRSLGAEGCVGSAAGAKHRAGLSLLVPSPVVAVRAIGAYRVCSKTNGCP